jgi:hypothetical protein
MWDQERVVFFLKVQNTQYGFVKPHGPPGPKDKEAETGRLTLGQGTAEADSSTDQRAAKEMAAGETDATSEPPI